MKHALFILITLFVVACTQDEQVTPTYTFELTELSNGQISVDYQSSVYGFKILMGESEADVAGVTAYYVYHDDDNTGCSNFKTDRISNPMYFRVVSSDGTIDETKKI